MKQRAVLLLAAVMVFGLSACSGGDRGGESGGLSGAVTMVGSTSTERVVGTLAEQFGMDHRGVTLSVEGGGSGAGIEAAANGTADIGLSSRKLEDAEREAGLVETVLALDGIAVIVNEKNPVADLSVEQLAALFTGRITNWSAVGGGDLATACIGREAGSGTRDGFESAIGAEDACLLAQELTSTGAVVEAVRGNPQAIGYASLASVEGQEGIRAITVGGVACTEDSIRDGSYAIQRPFVLVTREGRALSAQAQAFFDWATSPAAADLIRAAGAVPAA